MIKKRHCCSWKKAGPKWPLPFISLLWHSLRVSCLIWISVWLVRALVNWTLACCTFIHKPAPISHCAESALPITITIIICRNTLWLRICWSIRKLNLLFIIIYLFIQNKPQIRCQIKFLFSFFLPPNESHWNGDDMPADKRKRKIKRSTLQIMRKAIFSLLSKNNIKKTINK